MARVTLLLVVFTIIVSQGFALNFGERILEKLKRYHQFKNKRDADNIRSLNAQDLDTYLEVVLDAKKLLGRKENNQYKKQHNPGTLFNKLVRLGDPDSYQPIYTKRHKEPLLDILKSSYDKDMTDEMDDNETNRNKKKNIQATLFDQLTGLGNNDVLIYDPDNYQSKHRKRQKEPLLDKLKSSYDKDMTEEVDDNETIQNKKQNIPATLFDQLTGLGNNDVLVYDPDSYQSIHTKSHKEPLLDTLKSSHDKDMTDEADDNSPVFVLVKVDDSQRSEADSGINDMVSSLLKLSSLNQKNRSEGRPDHHYKGFRLKNSYRRARDSDETSSREIEDKRPQTRPRAFGGGRTPIPYLRHRGDIYERDN